jgi:hypothetical protein
MEGPHKAEIKAWVVEQLRLVDKSLKASSRLQQCGNGKSLCTPSVQQCSFLLFFLQGFERVTDFLIESDIDKMGIAFTEANGCMTPTFKLRRPQLLQRYIGQLKALYGANKEPVAADEKWSVGWTEQEISCG